MREVGQQPIPQTSNPKVLNNQVIELSKHYSIYGIRGNFDDIVGRTLKFKPHDIGTGEKFSKILFESNKQGYAYQTDDEWSIDLNDAADGIDLDTKIGGKVDTIPFQFPFQRESSYLIWAFLDESFNWAGIGATHRPYSLFTAISGGSANKGDTNKDFTVTDAYQFTIGSRGVARNLVGSTPMYQWNWWTIVDIINDTTIRVDMDDHASYGTNITGVTGGEIKQWDKWRPYVVETDSQTLYTPHYRLLGEAFTKTFGAVYISLGDEITIVRADEPFTPIANRIINQSGAIGNTLLSLGRFIPLWAIRAKLNAIILNEPNTAARLAIASPFPGGAIASYGTNSYTPSDNEVLFPGGFAAFRYNSTATSGLNLADCQGFTEPGGRRL